MTPPFASFVICTTPRSGSTLLCRLLAATGCAGAPDSHFHEPDVQGWLRDHELDRSQFPSEADAFHAVITAALRTGRGGTDLFGLRVQQRSAAYLWAQLRKHTQAARSDRHAIEAVFGPTLFVRLTRQNTLEQAISFVKASQTGLWHRAPDGREIERLSPPAPPIYDHTAIAAQIATLRAADAAWEAWIEEQRITPLRMCYEELSRTPRTVVATVLGALGKDPESARDIPLPVAKLSDQINADWATRFREENRTK